MPVAKRIVGSVSPNVAEHCMPKEGDTVAKKSDKKTPEDSKTAPGAAPMIDRGLNWRDNVVPLAVVGGVLILLICLGLTIVGIVVGVNLAGGGDLFSVSPFEGDAATLEYAPGGIDLIYPAEWVVEYSAGQVTLAESQDVLDYYDWNAGAMLTIVSGSAENFQSDFGGEATSEGLMDAITQAGWFEEVGEREVRRFDDQQGLGVRITLPEEIGGQGYLATFSDGEISAIVVALCQESAWEEIWPIFDAIMDSMVFYEPRASAERGELEPGETQSATLDPGGLDAWYYQSSGDEYISVIVTAVDDWDPTLEVFNEDGVSIGFNDDTNFLDPALMSLHLEDSGRYEFRVGAYSGHGRYEIRLVASDETGGGSLGYGDTVLGTLDWPGECEEWQFEGQAGDIISISMTGQGALYDTYLELYGPDGSELARNDDGGGGFSSLIGGYRLPEDGEYLIIARAFSSEIGPYELTLTEVQITEHPISYGQTREGELTASNPREYWVFEGEAGDMVVISMVGQEGLSDTYLELNGPDGQALVTDDDSGGGLSALIDGYMLPEDGEYWIVARPFGSGRGRYELSLSLLVINPITYGRTVTGELTAQTRREHWSFQGEAGDLITISMEARGSLRDVVLELYGPDGGYLAQGGGDFGDSAQIYAYLLPEDGEYHIVASTWSEVAGRYDLLVGPADIQERQIDYGETEDGELTEDRPREYWTFRGRDGDVVTILMEGLGSFSDTYLELYGPDGTPLTQNDDGGPGLFAEIQDYALPETGDYIIVARGFGGAIGSYELTLTVGQ
jgi:hypothetical protein